MITIHETKKRIEKDRDHWMIHLMDFADDFRYYKNAAAILQPFRNSDEKIDALLASVVEYLCSELHIQIPEWVSHILPVQNPWFVSGIENLKAIALVKSPLHFRKRKIFVMENFLQRV
jgi:hypothetical protein